MRLKTVITFLDETLKITDFPRDSSLNGLQVEACRTVRRAALAVDVCEKSIKRAARIGADLLIVHHGLFWGKMEPITGVSAVRVGLLFENSISLYAAHLPLDSHPEIGNNAQLARMLGIDGPEPFGRYRGTEIGMCGMLPRSIAPGGLANKLKGMLGAPVRVFGFGSARIARVGIVSGGGASLAEEAARKGLDALITGETSHGAYHIAREAGINLLCAGHYATETLGVRALGKLLRRESGLETRFIDIPTGL